MSGDGPKRLGFSHSLMVEQSGFSEGLGEGVRHATAALGEARITCGEGVYRAYAAGRRPIFKEQYSCGSYLPRASSYPLYISPATTHSCYISTSTSLAIERDKILISCRRPLPRLSTSVIIVLISRTPAQALLQITFADPPESLLAELGLPDLVLEVFRLPAVTHILSLEMYGRFRVPRRSVYRRQSPAPEVRTRSV